MPHDAAMNHVNASPPATAAGGVLSRTVFRATFENVRLAIEKAMSALSPLGLTEEEKSSVEIVLAEALNNIVEHAYPVPAPDQPIDINCNMRSDGLHVTIEDKGHPMPDGKAPIGMAQNLDVDLMDLPEGGFGWFLIQDLAKDVRYQRHETINRLDLRIAISMQRTQ